jgi:putative transposase
MEVFHKPEDYAAFLELLADASERFSLRLLGYCLMPNHFHLVVWPREDGDLSRFMQWLLTSHVRRHHRHYQGSGHVWQGRFKAFPIQEDEHLLTVLRYVERNAVRANFTRKAERWPWSSAGQPPKGIEKPRLDPGPARRGADWLSYVNQPQTEAELAALRRSVNRGAPFGSETWKRRTAERLGLESTLRPRGRPRNAKK